MGLQLNGQWQSASTIRAGSTPLPGDVRFAAYGALDTRVYLDFGQAGFSGNWAKGLRLTVFATNLLDARHRVQDRSGAVPLRYQPFLIDPLGRTAGVGLRKAF